MKKPRHILTLADLSSAEIERIFSIAEDLKAKWAKGIREPLLPGRVMALLFEKPSLRTRVSFEAGMIHLGGVALFLGEEAGFGRRESVADFARVLSQYVDVIVARTYQHQTVVDLAQYAACPVINGLSDLAHPCQALADLFTLRELFGRLAGRTLAWIGDGNNVARSLAQGCGKLGLRLVMATPPQYRFEEAFLEELRRDTPQLDLVVTDDPVEAVREASAVYTDVWTSMGQEAEAEQRRRAFARYQVNAALMARCQKGAVFMHCL
ncbi:MAG TPA: ornithine carbamoyltransferase, partial [Thermoguttaceae bacterium]|nr:ornithine carbamoyltransferase [Thermoguttaceae bacterium]